MTKAKQKGLCAITYSPLVFRESSSRRGFLLFSSRFINSLIAPFLTHTSSLPPCPPIRTKALDKPLAQPQMWFLLKENHWWVDYSWLEIPAWGNFLRTEDKPPQVLGKLLLLHCGWLHEADFALNISDKWLRQEGDFLLLAWFQRKKKKFFTIRTPRLSLCFPVEGGNVGSDFSETRQHASLQRNREIRVVSPSSRKTDDMVL